MVKKELVLSNYQMFRDFLKSKTCIDLKEGRAYLINSRLRPLVSQFPCESVDDLIRYAVTSDNQVAKCAVIEAMTTHETKWFRDVSPFEFLVKHIIPEVVKSNNAEKRQINILSSGCSTGQEPYSIAMAILEHAIWMKGITTTDIRITATDLSQSVIDYAKRGVYESIHICRGLEDKYLNNYFKLIQSGDGSKPVYQVIDAVKSMVTFKKCNLVDSRDCNCAIRYDVIFCRNVLIYFDDEYRVRIINYFKKILRPKGYIILGSSEQIPSGITDFKMQRFNNSIFYQLTGSDEDKQ